MIKHENDLISNMFDEIIEGVIFDLESKLPSSKIRATCLQWLDTNKDKVMVMSSSQIIVELTKQFVS
jgi:hypothetical protein